MSSLEELNADIAALKQKITANEAKVDGGTLSEAERVAIHQRISTDTTRLTSLEQERREVRLQQQQQAGECLFVPDEFIAAVFELISLSYFCFMFSLFTSAPLGVGPLSSHEFN
jgi:hypothetical protein